jgi:chromosome segregation ATPase
MAVVDLTLRRLERLEKVQQQTNEQLGRIVDVLEAHSRQFERVEEALIGIAERVDNMSARIDRLTTAIARGRTQDLARLEDHERRLRMLERRNGRRRRGPDGRSARR